MRPAGGLNSLKFPDRFYTGFTEKLDKRLTDHNSGKKSHTAKYRPWRIKTAIAFTDRQKVLIFESYLKTPSGQALAKTRRQKYCGTNHIFLSEFSK